MISPCLCHRPYACPFSSDPSSWDQVLLKRQQRTYGTGKLVYANTLKALTPGLGDELQVLLVRRTRQGWPSKQSKIATSLNLLCQTG